MARKDIRPCVVAVIGGSGLYKMEGLTEKEELSVDTPFGPPSDAILTGTLSGVRCAFLPRHGRDHTLLPSEINARANIWALKSLGAQKIISFGAVGSLQEAMAPGHFTIPDQIVDKTVLRRTTFFGNGIVAHVPFAEPFCAHMRAVLQTSAKGLNIRVHEKGTLVCMEGPLYSTRAESHTHRKLGYDIIGMTTIPEAKLAREAELCYAMTAMVTDYDCWKEGEEVSTEKVISVMHANSANAQRLLAAAIAQIAKLPACACNDALKNAIMTRPEAMPRETAEKLRLLIDKHVKIA
ncbi:MAG: S-methyl-5'-thioadenosine phosphorylase [Elusimicrobiota bacterium]|jgi:5'-methylthioadenosine phosphorylase